MLKCLLLLICDIAFSSLSFGLFFYQLSGFPNVFQHRFLASLMYFSIFLDFFLNSCEVIRCWLFYWAFLLSYHINFVAWSLLQRSLLCAYILVYPWLFWMRFLPFLRWLFSPFTSFFFFIIFESQLFFFWLFFIFLHFFDSASEFYVWGLFI